MDEANTGNDLERPTGKPRWTTGPEFEKPATVNRGARPGRTGKRATEASSPTQHAAPNVSRIRNEESPSSELGYRDQTVIDPGTPLQDQPKSHRRKVTEPKEEPVFAPVDFTPNVASLLLGLAEGMFTTAWGQEARFTLKERQMIEPPLGRILSRMTPGDAVKFAAFADPVFLCAGFLIYGVRIWTIQQQRNPGPRPVPIRPDAPVVQGMPADTLTVNHAPDGNGTGNVREDIARDWGAL